VSNLTLIAGIRVGGFGPGQQVSHCYLKSIGEFIEVVQAETPFAALDTA
jgi:hypothetical protein